MRKHVKLGLSAHGLTSTHVMTGVPPYVSIEPSVLMYLGHVFYMKKSTFLWHYINKCFAILIVIRHVDFVHTILTYNLGTESR